MILFISLFVTYFQLKLTGGGILHPRTAAFLEFEIILVSTFPFLPIR